MSAFLDTNVLVYAFDTADVAKQDRALAVLARLGHEGIVISTQVVSEFYSAVQRLAEPLVPGEALDAARSLLKWRVVGADADLLGRALEIRERWQPSYWDALIVAAAERAGVDTLYSEDFSEGQIIAGVTVVNPFADADAA